MKKKLMILGASNLQLPAIIKGKEMGLEVLAVDMDINAVGFEYADISLNISTIDIPGVIEAAKKHGVDAIMTLASDMPMRTVAAVSEELNIIGIGSETVANVTNKYLMRNKLKKYGVPIPKFFKAQTMEEYTSIISTGFAETNKFIVKPTDNSGSRGVFLVEDINNKHIVEYAFEYSKEHSRSGEVIVEEYMEGAEVSVETLTVNGDTLVIAMTDKITTGAPHFVELGHAIPSQLSLETRREIESVVINAIKSVGIIDGPSHTEVIVTNEGPKIVELGARLGGDNITTHLVPLATGVDMVESCIKIALGLKPTIQRGDSMASAIRYFKTSTGTISNIQGVEEANQLPGVVEIKFNRKVGDTVTEVTSSIDRVGYIISKSTCVEEAIAICEKAMNTVKFELQY